MYSFFGLLARILSTKELSDITALFGIVLKQTNIKISRDWNKFKLLISCLLTKSGGWLNRWPDGQHIDLIFSRFALQLHWWGNVKFLFPSEHILLDFSSTLELHKNQVRYVLLEKRTFPWLINLVEGQMLKIWSISESGDPDTPTWFSQRQLINMHKSLPASTMSTRM